MFVLDGRSHTGLVHGDAKLNWRPGVGLHPRNCREPCTGGAQQRSRNCETRVQGGGRMRTEPTASREDRVSFRSCPGAADGLPRLWLRRGSRQRWRRAAGASEARARSPSACSVTPSARRIPLQVRGRRARSPAAPRRGRGPGSRIHDANCRSRPINVGGLEVACTTHALCAPARPNPGGEVRRPLPGTVLNQPVDEGIPSTNYIARKTRSPNILRQRPQHVGGQPAMAAPTEHRPGL